LKVRAPREIGWKLILTSVFSTSLLLRIGIMPVVIPGSGHDDELMVSLGKSIADGNWLGDYGARGHLTLAKPPGFPIFLAATSALPFNALVWAHLIFLVGSWLIVRGLGRLGYSRKLQLLALFVLAFFPPLFGDSLSRIYRESFLAALVCLFAGLTLTIVLKLRAAEPQTRHEIVRLISMAGLATVAGFYAITKPGWFILLPPLLIVIVMAVKIEIQRTTPNVQSERSRRLQRAVRVLLLALAVIVPALAPSFIVRALNDQKYGVFTQDTFASGPFVDALNQLVRVEPRPARPYVLVDAGMRAQAYEVSPTFAELKPFLERGESEGWNGPSCGNMGICDESAGWFTWDLRDAVQGAGLGDSAQEFDRTLSKISQEIKDACESSKLECGKAGIAPNVLHPTVWSKRLFVNAVFMGAKYVWNLPAVGSGARLSLGELSSETRDLWEWATKSSSLDVPYTNYDPSYFNLSSALQFVADVYLFVWRALLITCGVLAVLRLSDIRKPGPRLIKRMWAEPRFIAGMLSAAFFLGFLLALLSLIALEVSSGVFLSSGGALYLPASFPLILVAVVMALHGTSQVWNNRFPGKSLDDPPAGTGIEVHV
jgi:hypothetical protein